MIEEKNFPNSEFQAPASSIVAVAIVRPFGGLGARVQRSGKKKNCCLCILRDPFLFFDSPLGVPVGTSAHVSTESFGGLRWGDTGGNKVILTAISEFLFSLAKEFSFSQCCFMHSVQVLQLCSVRETQCLCSTVNRMEFALLSIIISHCFRSSGQCNKRHNTEMRCKA